MTSARYATPCTSTVKPPPAPERLQALRALVCDCDGVLTPGDLYYADDGRRLLRFNSRDGFGLALLCRHLDVAVLSGRPVDVAQARFQELGVKAFVGRCRDKAAGLQQICDTFGVPLHACAFIGDDMPDLPALRITGLPIAVADAAPEVLEAAEWITSRPGGQGAVRDVAETILKARGDWQRWLATLPERGD